MFEAFVAGAWILYWTEATLYWVAKPIIHVETVGDRRRLHHDTMPALESEIENLYFWHGVLVPAFVVVRPDWITVQHIQGEVNAEVRRVMLERYGLDRYFSDIAARPVQADDFGTLYKVEFGDGRRLAVVRVTNGTPEPDGSYKEYTIPVPFECETAHQAVAMTYGLTTRTYNPEART